MQISSLAWSTVVALCVSHKLGCNAGSTFGCKPCLLFKVFARSWLYHAFKVCERGEVKVVTYSFKDFTSTAGCNLKIRLQYCCHFQEEKYLTEERFRNMFSFCQKRRIFAWYTVGACDSKTFEKRICTSLYCTCVGTCLQQHVVYFLPVFFTCLWRESF